MKNKAYFLIQLATLVFVGIFFLICFLVSKNIFISGFLVFSLVMTIAKIIEICQNEFNCDHKKDN